MITHNMHDAITHGNRLIMLSNGQVMLDIKGEEKQHLTVEKLLSKFYQASGEDFADDSVLLSKWLSKNEFFNSFFIFPK